MPEQERHARAETILANSGAKINHEQATGLLPAQHRQHYIARRNQFPTAVTIMQQHYMKLAAGLGPSVALIVISAIPLVSEGYARENYALKSRH